MISYNPFHTLGFLINQFSTKIALSCHVFLFHFLDYKGVPEQESGLSSQRFTTKGKLYTVPETVAVPESQPVSPVGKSLLRCELSDHIKSER